VTTAGLFLRNVSVSLGGRQVVRDISLELPRGRLAALVGPNGAGKTSVLRALVGLLPHSGDVALDGTPVSTLGRKERARRISYLPQGHEAHWPLPARDIVALGRVPHGADPTRLSSDDAAIVEEALRLTDTMHLADRPVTALSGGERARVALARVFAVRAPVILADEPIAALDPSHQLAVMAALKRAAGAGALVIAVTHDLGLAARFGDIVAVMEGGRLAAAGRPCEALTDEVLRSVFGVQAFRAVHQGGAVLLPWSPDPQPSASASR
jgi:iron complex transport system ATP-binding protein